MHTPYACKAVMYTYCQAANQPPSMAFTSSTFLFRPSSRPFSSVPTSCFMLQVVTAEQFALICIHSYPYISSGEQWMCAWKSDCCHESKEMLVAAAAVFDMKAEWEDLEALLAEPVTDGLASKRVSQGQAGKQAAAAPPAGFNLRDAPPNRRLAAVKSAPASSGHLPQHSWLSAAAEVAPGGPSGGSPMLCDDPSSWSAAALDPPLPKSKAPRVADSITFSATPALTPTVSAQQSRWLAAMLPTSLPSSETADWTQLSIAPDPMLIGRHQFRPSLGFEPVPTTSTNDVLSAHPLVVSMNTAAASRSVGSNPLSAQQSSEYVGSQSHRSSGLNVAPTSVSTTSGLLGGGACSWEATMNTILATNTSSAAAQSPSFTASAATVPSGSTSAHAHQSNAHLGSAQLSGAHSTSWGATMDSILATSNPLEAAQSSWSTSPALSDPTLLAINREGAQHCLSGLPNANPSASIPFGAMQQSWLPLRLAVGGNLHDCRPSTWLGATRTCSMPPLHSQRGLTNSPTVTPAFGTVSGAMHNSVIHKSWASEGPETGTALSIAPGMNGVPTLSSLTRLNAGDAAHSRIRSSSACLDLKEKHHYNLSMY